MRIISTLLASLTIIMLFSGCFASSRYTLLQDYESSGAKVSGLAGKRLHVTAVEIPFDVSKDFKPSVTPVEAQSGFSFAKMSPAAEAEWDKELRRLKGIGTKEQWTTVGWVYSGIGIHMGDVYAVTPPSAWIAGVLRQDLVANGAVMVEDLAQAEQVCRVSVVYLKSSLYSSNTVNLEFSCTIEAPGKPIVTRTYAATSSRTSWSGSSFEIFEAMRQTWQVIAPTVLNDFAHKKPE